MISKARMEEIVNVFVDDFLRGKNEVEIASIDQEEVNLEIAKFTLAIEEAADEKIMASISKAVDRGGLPENVEWWKERD